MRVTFDRDTVLPQPLQSWLVGGGSILRAADHWRLALPALGGEHYADAQISDYTSGNRRTLRWSPPVRLTITAWASGPAEALAGTAGFGFWNDPFVPGRAGLPRLPRAVWFFFSGPHSNMALARDRRGNGWKAAVFGPRLAALAALAPLALPGFVVMRVPLLYRLLWPVGQAALGVAEADLPGEWLAEPHRYTLTWLPQRVRFAVDGETVIETERSPRGPLGFVAWIDNQYAVVTPQGRFAWGIAPTAAQWLALSALEIESLENLE
ncbi:MAG: hypothetical protein Kow0077_16090 [Anaerolineae bacterium]